MIIKTGDPWPLLAQLKRMVLLRVTPAETRRSKA
jgi:hypothetical protein